MNSSVWAALLENILFAWNKGHESAAQANQGLAIWSMVSLYHYCQFLASLCGLWLTWACFFETRRLFWVAASGTLNTSMQQSVKCCSIVAIIRYEPVHDKTNQRTNGPVKRSPDIWAKHKITFGSKWPNHFWEKPVLIFKCKWPWAKVKKWPWPSILTYLHYLNWFQVTGCNSSEKPTFSLFSYR